jgi:hypothetical protein
MADYHGAYDPHMGCRVDADGVPIGPEPERIVDPRNQKVPPPPEPKRPWDDARRAALLAEIRRSVKHFKPDPWSERHKEHPDASRDELAKALCDLLTKDWTDAQVDLHLRSTWLLPHRQICQLLSFRRRA